MRNTYITKLDGKWYAFEGDLAKDQVCGIGADRGDGYIYCARWNYKGILYVATPSPNRRAAYRKATRGGHYAGEV